MDADIFRPEQWHDFFLMVGGGAAALAGLVFVAVSINLTSVISDALHRSRAIGTLAGFTAVFMICALALMGDQNHVTIGIGWLIIASADGVIDVNGYIRAVRSGRSSSGLTLTRLIPGTTCHLVQAVGA